MVAESATFDRQLYGSDELSTSREGYPDERVVFESTQDLRTWLASNPLPNPQDTFPHADVDRWAKHLPSNGYYPSGKGAFNYASTYEQAERLLDRGWAEGRDKMLGWEGKVRKAFQRHVEMPHFRLGEDGSDIEMGRYLSGEPEHMLAYRSGDTEKLSPLILVDANIACNACSGKACDFEGSRPDWLMMRGAVLYLMVRLMRQGGLHPEVWLGTSAFYANQTHTSANMHLEDLRMNPEEQVKNQSQEHNPLSLNSDRAYRLERPAKAKKRSIFLKVIGANSLLDPAMMAFALAHDSVPRRLLFRVEEALNFQEAGVFPMLISNNSDGRGVSLERNMPRDVGALPVSTSAMNEHGNIQGIVTRIDPVNAPDWTYLVGKRRGSTAIRLPSYTALKDAAELLPKRVAMFRLYMKHDVEEGLLAQARAAQDALGSFEQPEGAAGYMLDVLKRAGVNLHE